MAGTDIQSYRMLFFANVLSANAIRKHLYTTVTKNNIIPMCIYLTVRQVIEPSWINDRDHFLYPDDKWEEDLEFQSDCLAFTLFHGQNRITSEEGINHWIPFSEAEVEAKNNFESHFMKDFIDGKIKPKETKELLTASGRMNNKSIDETYNKLIGNLRERMKILAKKIEPKIYEFGFLKK
ncbi:hypothetical protein [Brachyspira aalborgi]|uniref:Uncharacterized protein n=1 Tax=Brachyspira aalborgi TaxID=29522 RepID=A0A5C8CK81_9SPIR|nr:hypothetical protein [Brachyspira aalborgi]TXJ13288.1 hypothetical protein EPJ80_00650 [Brachyspira aalborgi]